jgi:hypothetical protein
MRQQGSASSALRAFLRSSRGSRRRPSNISSSSRYSSGGLTRHDVSGMHEQPRSSARLGRPNSPQKLSRRAWRGPAAEPPGSRRRLRVGEGGAAEAPRSLAGDPLARHWASLGERLSSCKVGCDPPSEAFVAPLFTGADNVDCTAHPAALARSKRGWSFKADAQLLLATAGGNCPMPTCNEASGSERAYVQRLRNEHALSAARPAGAVQNTVVVKAKRASRAHLCAKSESKHQRRMRWLTSSRS